MVASTQGRIMRPHIPRLSTAFAWQQHSVDCSVCLKAAGSRSGHGAGCARPGASARTRTPRRRGGDCRSRWFSATAAAWSAARRRASTLTTSFRASKAVLTRSRIAWRSASSATDRSPPLSGDEGLLRGVRGRVPRRPQPAMARTAEAPTALPWRMRHESAYPRLGVSKPCLDDESSGFCGRVSSRARTAC
jgi:hypothetical protein